MKSNLILIGIMLSIFFVSGCAQIITKCEPNYILDDEHSLIPDRQTNPTDLETIQKFNVRKECLDGSEVKEIWIQKPRRYISDSPYEKVMYCENENKFLVVKSLGIAGGRFFLFEGKPCK